MTERYSEEFPTIVIEGSDQCGKGDATDKLAKHFVENGSDTLEISFPCYATPIGYAIRHILSNGYPEDLDISPDEHLVIKMGLFALNRLEVVNYIESILKEENGIMLFDRSPYSNVLTIAYHMCSNPMSRGSMFNAISTAMDMDRFIIERYGLDECVIRLLVEGVWNAQREVEDLHDKKDVQDLSSEIYFIMSKIWGKDRWKDVVTRKGEQWRSREDILKDIIEFINSKYDIPREDAVGSRSVVTAQKVVEKLYNCNLPEGSYDLFDDSLRGNNKKGLYEHGESVAKMVVKSKYDIQWYDKDIKDAIKNILKYSKNFELVLNYIYGNDFGTNFVNSVLDE